MVMFSPQELAKFKKTEEKLMKNKKEALTPDINEVRKNDALAAFIINRELSEPEQFEYNLFITLKARNEGKIRLITKAVPDLGTGGDKLEYGLSLSGKEVWFKDVETEYNNFITLINKDVAQRPDDRENPSSDVPQAPASEGSN